MSCHETQNQQVLTFVKKHKFITRWQAAQFGCMNLWSRIAELETPKYGAYRFDRRPTKSRTGKRVLQYWLVESKQQRKAA